MKRSENDVLVSILWVARKRCSKSRIFYGANTSGSVGNRYLSLLRSRGLIGRFVGDDDKVVFQTNAYGFEVIREYKEFIVALRGREFSFKELGLV